MINADDKYIISNWGLLNPNLRLLCQSVGIRPNNEKELVNEV